MDYSQTSWGSIPLQDFDMSTLKKNPFSRIGRVCDFTIAGQKYQEQRAAKGKGKKGQILAPVKKDSEGFALVDNRTVAKPFGKGRSKAKGKGKGLASNYQEGILGQKQRYVSDSDMKGGKGKFGKGGKGSKGKSKKGKGKTQSFTSFREWSVPTQTHWEVRREIQLSALSKLQIDSKTVEMSDLLWCGKLHNYNRDYDKITTKTERSVRRFENLNFWNISTSDDPALTNYLQSDEECTVIATDHVLACLIAAIRSVYSWDIVVSKLQNKLIFDKRDGSQIDFLTVNETAREPPNHDTPDSVNSPLKLGQEASCINQNFSQMVLDYTTEPEHMEQPNPFEEEGEEDSAASGAYRYRKITLPGNPKDEDEFRQSSVSLIVRTEVGGKMPGADGSFVLARALNEYDPKSNSAWRSTLESQRGAVLATELKNNAFKLGRWAAQAILSGCDVLKIGYASRKGPTDPWNHTLLGVQTYNTTDFAEQIGMNRNNAFGILRNIIDEVMATKMASI
jgi:translation initiation factor 3 subunit D